MFMLHTKRLYVHIHVRYCSIQRNYYIGLKGYNVNQTINVEWLDGTEADWFLFSEYSTSGQNFSAELISNISMLNKVRYYSEFATRTKGKLWAIELVNTEKYYACSYRPKQGKV